MCVCVCVCASVCLSCLSVCLSVFLALSASLSLPRALYLSLSPSHSASPSPFISLYLSLSLSLALAHARGRQGSHAIASLTIVFHMPTYCFRSPFSLRLAMTPLSSIILASSLAIPMSVARMPDGVRTIGPGAGTSSVLPPPPIGSEDGGAASATPGGVSSAMNWNSGTAVFECRGDPAWYPS